MPPTTPYSVVCIYDTDPYLSEDRIDAYIRAHAADPQWLLDVLCELWADPAARERITRVIFGLGVGCRSHSHDDLVLLHEDAERALRETAEACIGVRYVEDHR